MDTRLRKAFKYPEESDEGDDIDEEEQEKLIRELKVKDAARTDLYSKAFVAMTIPVLLYYAPDLIHPGNWLKFVHVLISMESILMSAYIMYFFPLPPPVPDKYRTPWDSIEIDSVGPLAKYLVYLNGMLSMMAFLNSWAATRKTGGDYILQGVIPGFIFILFMIVRIQLRPVDVDGLERLKYHYKGA
ncbi:hypothetical protein M501DRAFT_1014762 [Patellaria atrata CBS 101060]|uniref:Uncharacterized protein n=1 Tax=Patellaria atrata CBS 101060 TaxID=1346257 RepID=A0A9P4VUM3_9PEZI|nr:hypothetical protein M501DRAFT_1014762 [Patellaria atrata CBS 101060]